MAISTYLLMIGELGVERELLARASVREAADFKSVQIPAGPCVLRCGPEISLLMPQASLAAQPNSSKPVSPLLALLEPH